MAYDIVYLFNMTIAKERARSFSWNFSFCLAEFEMMNSCIYWSKGIAWNGHKGKTTELLQPRTSGRRVLTSVSVFSVLTMFTWGLWSRPGKTAALYLTFFYRMHTIAKDNKWPLSTPLLLLVICPIRGTIRWGAQIHLWPPYKIKPLWTLYFTHSLIRPF